MVDRFNVIVIGSGFGGAITAARLAEGGARVLVLERGRRWTADQHPRRPTDAWLYRPNSPAKHNGWLDLRFFPRMIVAQGAGVGGGSLCYSAVLLEARPELFDAGWPPEITYKELRPYYAKVRDMLGVRPIPSQQLTARARLLQRASAKLGHGDRFTSVPLGMTFDESWNYGLDDPLGHQHSKSFVNQQGQRQGTCVHLGNCDIGCDVRAKNTLDLNYIPLAERHGAEVRPLHIVRRIEPDGTGYRVYFDRIDGERLIPGSVRAEKVVLAAGSLGTTELLLRCRDEYRTVPNISRRLGKHWSPNANFLTPATYPDGDQVKQGIGPTITSGLDFLDGSVNGQRFSIQDDGFPNVLLNAMRAELASPALRPVAWLLERRLARGLDEENPTRNVMVWLGQGIDAADGELRLSRRFAKPWEQGLDLKWRVDRSKELADTILEMHRRLSEATGGQLHVPLFWRLLRGMISVHPLGGCGMGRSRAEGVVDHAGRVFGYKNLFVADGAIFPGAAGSNPSMTIGALSERIADLMLRDPGAGAER
ncbi:GMC family oxidoreductase [Sorangium sp. So ce291]|uniref:GMC oxidoreductase n=1 Tax=Sorangium sp. So ce291 TaxID=3133294 RepID=UPI003F610232